MPPLKPTKGRKVWRVYLDAEHRIVTSDEKLVSLFDGKMFTTKDVAERFAMRAVIEWPEFIGEIVVEEYTCTGEEGKYLSFKDTAWFVNPPCRKRRHVAIRKRRRIKQLWTP